MLSFLHCLMTIWFMRVRAEDTLFGDNSLKSTGFFSFGKLATPLKVCINGKDNGVAKSIQYYCNKDKSGVLSGEWDGFDCNGSAKTENVEINSTYLTAHYECDTAVSYFMGVIWGNHTGSCAQNDDYWIQNPLVVFLCIPSTYNNGAKTAPGWYISDVYSCSFYLNEYSSAKCSMWDSSTSVPYNVGCSNGICNTADPNRCSVEQKCPIALEPTSEPTATILAPTAEPTAAPVPSPSIASIPTREPSPRPTTSPTRAPTSAASPTPGPTLFPTPSPIRDPTSVVSPTPEPTPSPTPFPTPTPTRTTVSAATPTSEPTPAPTSSTQGNYNISRFALESEDIVGIVVFCVLCCCGVFACRVMQRKKEEIDQEEYKQLDEELLINEMTTINDQNL